MILASDVHALLKDAGIPVIGVSVGVDADKSTWKIQFDPTATPAQQVLAWQLVDAFTPKTSLPALTCEQLVNWLAPKFGLSYDDALAQIRAK